MQATQWMFDEKMNALTLPMPVPLLLQCSSSSIFSKAFRNDVLNLISVTLSMSISQMMGCWLWIASLTLWW